MTDNNSKDRKAGALWTGDLKTGSGLISTESTALFELPYSNATRFDDEVGLNPEELIAAAPQPVLVWLWRTRLNAMVIHPYRPRPLRLAP